MRQSDVSILNSSAKVLAARHECGSENFVISIRKKEQEEHPALFNERVFKIIEMCALLFPKMNCLLI